MVKSASFTKCPVGKVFLEFDDLFRVLIVSKSYLVYNYPQLLPRYVEPVNMEDLSPSKSRREF
jgi:hypothetical protein